MTKSQRLTPIARIAGSKERSASHDLVKAQRMLDECETRLAELVSYRDDYQRRLHAAGAAGLEAGQMHEYLMFIARLDQAIARQREALAETVRSYERLKLHWLALHGKTLALDKAVERFRGEESRLDDRREQHESDELAQHVKPKP
ncbi:MAG: flagellar export protein FliJ [Gammaproteobacteria bacterium]|nr:flagellar export protein FliJ [Gammaproteobacteria bacterium]